LQCSSVLDRWFLAIGVRCCFCCLTDDRCGFSGSRQRRSATVDPICGETAESRRNLRARRVGTRSRRRGRADRALRALFARGRHREFEERTPLFIHSLEDLGGLQLNCECPCANYLCYFHASYCAKDILSPPPPWIITIRKTMYSKHILQMHINTINVYKNKRI